MAHVDRTVRRIAGTAGAFVVAAVAASPAGAAALYFERTASEATCLRFAAQAARSLPLRNMHSNRFEVAGERNGACVSMTCVGRGQNMQALAVVMAVADGFDAARQAGGEVAAKLEGITCFDDC